MTGHKPDEMLCRCRRRRLGHHHLHIFTRRGQRGQAQNWLSESQFSVSVSELVSVLRAVSLCRWSVCQPLAVFFTLLRDPVCEHSERNQRKLIISEPSRGGEDKVNTTFMWRCVLRTRWLWRQPASAVNNSLDRLTGKHGCIIDNQPPLEDVPTWTTFQPGPRSTAMSQVNRVGKKSCRVSLNVDR